MRLPGDDASGLDWLLFEQAGILTTTQATRYASRSRMRHRIAIGQWRVVTRGVLVTQTGDLTREQMQWIAVLAAGPGSVLAGLAAAQAGGLQGRWRKRDVIDVLRRSTRRVPAALRGLPMRMPLVKVHRTTLWNGDDHQRGRPDRTSMARSLVDAASWAYDDEEAVSIISAGCQQRRVRPEEIVAMAGRFPHRRRNALIVETARFASVGATSPPEIDFLRLCRRHGLPAPVMQVPRKDGSGRRRFLDAYFEAFGVHVEIDGAQHLDYRAWAADMKRQNEIWIPGDRILRFPAFLIRANPEEVLAQLRAALRAAGWPG